MGVAQHGVNAYKSGKCRCEKCCEANTAYQQRRKRNPMIMPGWDTLTRGELLQFRNETAKKDMKAKQETSTRNRKRR
jgi:hypothetical protein